MKTQLKAYVEGLIELFENEDRFEKSFEASGITLIAENPFYRKMDNIVEDLLACFIGERKIDYINTFVYEIFPLLKEGKKPFPIKDIYGKPHIFASTDEFINFLIKHE
jgi:hypothetical protein